MPRPVSSKTKWLRGNPGGRPPRRPVSAKVESLPVPRGTEEAIAREWRRLVPWLLKLGVPLAQADIPGLLDMSLCAARVRQAEELVSSQGILVDSKRAGALCKNPAIQVSRDYATRFMKWCVRFGVSPADRRLLDLPEEPEPGDKMGEYFSRGKEGAYDKESDGEQQPGEGDGEPPEPPQLP